ncbi:MAG: hypothetical protein DLM68_01950 [Hyphomicrobiales bacterium]|nr:MAG: hypothetical protein DLM68_01950 [Hyphomicrobiales bacterium]
MSEAHSLCDEHGDVASANLFENWIDEAERLVWLLFETSRQGLVTVQSVLLATFGFSIQKYFEVTEKITENIGEKDKTDAIKAAMQHINVQYVVSSTSYYKWHSDKHRCIFLYRCGS